MRIRTRLFCTCAVVLVMGTVAAVLPADAQGGFLGNITSAVGIGGGGSPTLSRSGTSDIIDLYSTQSVIDWRPNDQTGTAPIDFLPAGNTVTFRNGISTTFNDFTVLNRIQPVDGNGTATSRVINLNGLVQSQINGTTAGSVWFYTPGGIVVGSTGVFNVGSLVLTSNPIDTTGGLFGTGNAIRFRGAAGNLAGVTINSGAQINATAANSYVALVAPRVVQGGTVTVNGSTAYVAAEQADIRINGGLFDIAITAGTTDQEGIRHTGTTTGPAPVNFADRQNIYMVAVPKNNALTMLLSGTAGYTSAADVTQDSSAVILSAGYSLQNNAETGNLDYVAPGTATGPANATVGAGNILSTLSLSALGNITIAPTAPLQFGKATSIDATNSITMTAGAGVTISAANGLALRAGSGATGGSISLAANGAVVAPQGQGLINVTGALTLDTTGAGDIDQFSALGGPVTLTADRGTISADTLDIQTTGNAISDAAVSGNATGGDAGFSVANAGQMNFTSTTIDASGNSIFNAQTLPVNGSDAAGGTIRFFGTGGSLNLGVVRATAQASGGSATTGSAGDATSGNIIVDLSSGTHDWTSFFGDVSTAAGFLQSGQGTAGSTLPGATGISVDISGTAAFNIATSVSLYGNANSAGGSDVSGVTQAAPVRVQARDGGALRITDDLTVQAAGRASNFFFGSGGNRTNAALGGTIFVGASGGTFSAAGLNIFAGGESAIGAISSGSATGGNMTLAAASSNGLRGSLSLTDCVNFGCSVGVNAVGAGGDSNGRGGNILAYASDADMTIASMSLNAEGQGGSSDQLASTGIGGTISIESRRGALNNGTLSIGSLFVSASAMPQLLGESSNLSNGDASGGRAGSVTLLLGGGSFTADTVTLTADGSGSDAGANCMSCSGGGTTPFQAGTGTGGTIDLQLAGANATIGTLSLRANGTGGTAQGLAFADAVSAVAGTGTGGTANFTTTAGTLTVDTLTIEAAGTGGSGNDAFEAGSANGSAGFGGTASFVMDAGGSAIVNARSLTISAGGQGGAGGAITTSDNAAAVRAGSGGDGTGGTASALLASGSLNTSLLLVKVDGIGGAGGVNGSDGNGGDAGGGTGGSAQLAYASEGHDIETISLSGSGRGGIAGDAKNLIDYDQFDAPIYAFGIGRGGNGGSGSGGRASMRIDVDPVLANIQINANGAGSTGGIGATGGNGGAGNGGANGLGAELAVNFGSLTVTDRVDISAEGFGGAGGNGTTGRGGDGSIGTAGESGLIATGGSTQVQTNIIQIISFGLGGDGGDSGTQSGGGLAGGNGGAAFGGTAGLLVSDNAQFTLGQSTLISAGAIGGTGRGGTASSIPGNGGSGGSGGNATGGTARLAVSNAILTDGADGDVQIYAGAMAGVGGFGASDGGLGGRGGDAVGGIAEFEGASGTISLNGVAVEATANGGTSQAGGTGSIGGSALGGTANATFLNFVGTLQPAPGTTTIASLTLLADARGGGGGNGLNAVGGGGGEATGGNAAASVDGAGTVLNLGAFDASASAFGGDGGSSGGSATTGAIGGAATGGRVAFTASGDSATTLAPSITLLAEAAGGEGGNGAAGAAGGNGGDGGVALGGNADFTIRAAQVRASNSGAYTISTQGTGGAAGGGGNGTNSGASGGIGGNGGDGTGGRALFDAVDGNFDLPDMSILANGTGGSGGIGGTGAGIPGNPSATPPVPPSGPVQSGTGLSGGGIGGVAQLLNGDAGTLASGAQRTVSGVTLQANGIFPVTSTFGFAPTAGRINITDTSSGAGGGLVVNGALLAEAFGDTSCGCSGIFVASSANPIQTGNASLSSDGPISFAFAFAFASSGSFHASGALSADSGGAITVTQGSQGAAPVDSLFGDTLLLNAQGNILADARTILRAGDSMTISSQAGSVQVDRLFAGRDIDVAAGGSVLASAAAAGGLLQLSATAGTAEGERVSGGRVIIAGDQGISFGGIASQGTTSLTAANGAIQSADLASVDVVTATGQGIDLTGTGTLNFASATATAGDLNVTAAALGVTNGSASNDMSLTSTGGSITAGALTAGRSLTIIAQGTARFDGQASASTIAVTSGDIVIGSGARLGLQGVTGALTLNATFGQGRDYIGGADQASAYSLSGDEMTRLFAQNILINPQGQSTIGGFTLTSGASGNLGPNGLLTIDSAGRMEVVGAVQLTGLGTQGGLALRSGNGIDVFTDTGSIDLRGGGTALGGVLTMEGASIAVATRSAINDITGINVSLDSRNARLARNDGAVNDEGFLRAGAINANVIAGAYIQNSGASAAFADRRGFSANSVAVTTEGSGTEIVINGRLTDSLGGFVAGVGTVPLVSINGVPGGQASAYADRSTINGCLIANVASCTTTIEVPMTPDNRDSIDRVLDPTLAVSQIFPVAIVELRDFVAEGYPPLIDEPVTGAGNEDLWDSDCSVAGDEKCDQPVAQ